MNKLVIASIFRDSEAYLPRYLNQITALIDTWHGDIGFVWLEGDSVDNTRRMLTTARNNLLQQRHSCELLRHDTNQALGDTALAGKERMTRLANCWNMCLSNLPSCAYTIVVESDLIWDTVTVLTAIAGINNNRRVIAPKLMIEGGTLLTGNKMFYDTHGFSKKSGNFTNNMPYWLESAKEKDERYLRCMTMGGMLVSKYETQRDVRFALSTCILDYPDGCGLFMDKTLSIYHPPPRHIYA